MQILLKDRITILDLEISTLFRLFLRFKMNLSKLIFAKITILIVFHRL